MTDDIYFDNEFDFDYKNDSEEKMSDKSDDNEYNEYDRYDRDYYFFFISNHMSDLYIMYKKKDVIYTFSQ